MKIVNLLGCILDLFAMVYFFCMGEFKCLEYYVFYGYHVILAIVSCVGAMTSRSNNYCSFETQFIVAIFASAFILLLSSVIIMASTLYFSLKYAHFGSNIVWFLMWLFGETCVSIPVTLVAVIHGLLSFTGFLLFIINKFQRKTSFSAKLWKVFTCVSVTLMIVCYLIILFGLIGGPSCQSAEFFKKNYEIYGLLEIVSPILILIFLKGE